ncbi:MAG: hypothetical protein ACXVBE_16300, partial [Bdellovibrionota bacterium]
EVARRCPECKIETLKDRYGEWKYRVHVEDWHFDITLDPGMVEVTGKPITDITLSLAEKMKLLIWDVARKLHLNMGEAGHLNLGIESTFGKDSRLFYNFYVDYMNHTGLAEGVFGYQDTANAPHPERLAPKPKKGFVKVLDEFSPEKDSIKDFAGRLYHEAFYSSPGHGGIDGELPQKYQAGNIISIVNEDGWPRLELRAIPMQSGPEELELWQRLFGARMEFLKKHEGLVAYTAQARHGEQTAAEMVEEFHRYVTESGLEWNEFKVLVSAQSRFQKALEKFDHELHLGCAKKYGSLRSVVQ